MSRAGRSRRGTLLPGAVLLLLLVLPREAHAAPAEVLVLDAGGRPLAGAQLIAGHGRHGGRVVFDARRPVLGASDARGRIALAELDGAGGAGHHIVSAAGHAPVLLPGTGQGRVVVRLLAAHPSRGVIRRARGKPVAGQTVLAVPAAPAAELVHAARTDAKGAYAFPQLHAGAWSLFLEGPGGRIRPVATVQAGEGAGEVRLGTATSIEGRILDLDGVRGAAAGDVAVRLFSMAAFSDEAPVTFRTRADGRFLVADVPPGIHEVRIEDPRWAFHPRPPRVAVEPGRAHDLPAWFAVRRRPVRGRVQTEDGAPLAGVAVRLVPEPGRPLPVGARAEGTDTVTSDAAGRFELPLVAPGEGYRLLATAAGRSPFVSAPFRVDRGTPTELKPFPLRRGWRVALKVETLDGEPVAGARVVGAAARRPSSLDDPLWAPTVRRGVTGADGTLELVDLPADDVLLGIEAEGFVEARTVVAYPRVSDRRTAEVVLHRSAAIDGRLTAVEGAPRGPFRITARRRDGGGAQVTEAAPDGRFRLTDLATTAYDLQVHRLEGDEATPLVTVEGVRPGDEELLEIALPATWAVEGTVDALHLDAREPRVVVETRVHDPEEQAYVWRVVREAPVTRSHTQGRFRVEGLPPGAYTARVVQGMLDTGTTGFVIQEGDVEGLALRMPNGARIAGAVMDAEGAPVLGARVRLLRMHGEHAFALRDDTPLEAFADDRGDFVFEDLAPGLWRVEATDEERAPDVRVVRVRDGEVLVLDDLVLSEGARIEGVVRDADGRPLDGVHVIARRYDGDGPAATLRTDAEGRFTARHLRPGAWRLTVDAATVAGGPWTEALVEALAGETAMVSFEAAEDGAIGGTLRERGKPVAGAVIDLVHDTPAAGAAMRRYRTSTGVDGRFRFEALEAGRYTLQVQSGAWRTSEALVLLAGDDLDLDLESHEARLRGTVVTRDDRPVGGAEVVARPTDEAGRVLDGAGFFAEGRTDPRGRFVLRGLPPGAYRVTVTAEGLPPGRFDGAVADLPGADYPIEIVVGRGGDVALRVVDESDRGVTGAQVWIEDPDGVPLHARAYVTGAAGRLRIVGVTAGPVRLRVRARDLGRPDPLALVVEEGGVHPVTIRLLPAGSLHLTVTGTGPDPLLRTRVDIVRAGSGEVVAGRRPLSPIRLAAPWGWVPRTGAMTIGELAAGRYVARISAGRAYEEAEVPFEVEAGLETGLRVTLQAR